MAKIGVFDSGYGGLTILKEIRKTLPEYDYIYFNTTSYENTYSFKEDKIFCRSDDYNDRVLLTGTTRQTQASFE